MYGNPSHTRSCISLAVHAISLMTYRIVHVRMVLYNRMLARLLYVIIIRSHLAKVSRLALRSLLLFVFQVSRQKPLDAETIFVCLLWHVPFIVVTCHSKRFVVLGCGGGEGVKYGGTIKVCGPLVDRHFPQQALRIAVDCMDATELRLWFIWSYSNLQ